MRNATKLSILLVILVAIVPIACGKKAAPATQPQPPVTSTTTPAPTPPAPPPQRVEDTMPVPAEPLGEDSIANRSLDDLNRDSPFRPAFFASDSAELDDEGRAVVTANAATLKKYSSWVVTLEGHCDERGSAEYNLALGERRAIAVRTYLVSLGITSDRLRTVSYGKEFPFDPGHDEAAWARNRRAQFVITAK